MRASTTTGVTNRRGFITTAATLAATPLVAAAVPLLPNSQRQRPPGRDQVLDLMLEQAAGIYSAMRAGERSPSQLAAHGADPPISGAPLSNPLRR